MKNELPYTSSIKDMPLMFSEMKRTALLFSEGKSSTEIESLAMEQNIYQLDKPKRRRDVALRMIKRLSAIAKPLVDVIADGCDTDAKLVSFFSLVKADRLLFEYMYEVYADRHTLGYSEISDKNFFEFIERKAQSSEIVAKWSPKSIASIRSTIKNVLCEAGLAKRSDDKLLIQKPIVDDGLLKLFDEADRVYARTMLLM